jgi:hypothetical protein
VNSNEIKNVEMVSSGAPIEHVLYRACEWLQQIAYQLAVMNERNVERASRSLEDEQLRCQALIATLRGVRIPPEPIVDHPLPHCPHFPKGPEECGRCYHRRTMS